MRSSRLRYFGFALMAAIAFASATDAPDDDPLNDPAVQKTLRAMNDASTWFHPDLFGEFAGVRYYTRHQYNSARKYFEIGARYADKFSQLNLGLMYLNGESGPKDPVTAEAWLELAAERGYPDFVATRDRVKATLAPDQLRQAQQVYEDLAKRYGDAIAKRRMSTQLALGRMQITGSHLGAFGNILHANTSTSCHGTTVIGGQAVPQAGCSADAIYAESRWDPQKYFAVRDAQWKATVTVGDVTPGTPPADKSDNKH